uniref:Eukaryotic translation initiation factor 4E family member 2 n=1 Tax=Chelonoidis abingdonii TaxID=106734 RepID=A0A8C0ISA1_CHEAB
MRRKAHSFPLAFASLKDDDSGDHDQNEENSTQKDGEKEKNDRDKPQSSTKRKVEQFWRFYSHMVRPGDLTGHSDFHLFKEGIKPMWEDDANKNGGKWIIRLRKGLASRCWENLILAMLGEQFMVGEEIFRCKLLHPLTASDQATTARIRDTLRRVLNLPPNTIMEYKTHTDSIKYVRGQGEGASAACCMYVGAVFCRTQVQRKVVTHTNASGLLSANNTVNSNCCISGP